MGITVVKIASDGMVIYNNDGNITKSGRHKVSPTYDVARCRMHVYCDGEYVYSGIAKENCTLSAAMTVLNKSLVLIGIIEAGLFLRAEHDA